MKKILSFFLTVVMIFFASYICVAAEKPTITVGSAQGKTGDIVEVTFSIGNNPGFAGGEMEIVYDKNNLRITEITPVTLPSNTEYNINTGKIAFGSSSNNTENGTLFRAKFEILTRTNKEYSVSLNFTEFYNADDNDLNQIVVPGGVTVVNSSSLPGDINSDGKVNNTDVIALFNYVSGFDVGVDTARLDTDGNGAVDNKDVVRLFQYVSKVTKEIY